MDRVVLRPKEYVGCWSSGATLSLLYYIHTYIHYDIHYDIHTYILYYYYSLKITVCQCEEKKHKAYREKRREEKNYIQKKR